MNKAHLNIITKSDDNGGNSSWKETYALNVWQFARVTYLFKQNWIKPWSLYFEDCKNHACTFLQIYYCLYYCVAVFKSIMHMTGFFYKQDRMNMFKYLGLFYRSCLGQLNCIWCSFNPSFILFKWHFRSLLVWYGNPV